MTKYPHILAEIASTPWLITQEALDGIYKAVEQGLTIEDYSTFHKADEKAYDVFDGIPEGRKSFVSGNLGYLFVDGPIVPRDNVLNRASSLTSIQTLTREYKELSANRAMEQINLVIDSPGGAVTGVSEFAQLISQSPKPVVAYIIGQAASAAYWIASGASKIYAADTSMSGSIGVIFKPARFDTEAVVSTQSPNKWPDPSTISGRQVVQDRVDDLADVMIDFIAKRRGVSKEYVIDNFGKGGTLIASRALEVGMIDGISTLSDFVAGQIGESAELKFKDQKIDGNNNTTEPQTGATEREQSMTGTNQTPVAAPTVDVEAVRREARALAIADERARLQAIEAVAKSFDSEPQAVQQAVRTAIDKAKYAEGATAESVKAVAYQAAFNAQKAMVNDMAGPKRDLGKALAGLPTPEDGPKETEDTAIDPKRIERMRAAFRGGR